MAERRKQFLLEPEEPESNASHLREVGGADHIPNISMTLRMARQRAGYEIKDVAQVLRIRASSLEAIEAGRFKDLPGPTYVTGFLRSYADFLGLDRDEIIDRYREEIGAASRQKLSFPVPSYEGRVPRAWLILIALALVGLAYAGWHYYSNRDVGPRETVAEPPAETEVAPEPAITAEPPTTPAAAEPNAPAATIESAPSDATNTASPTAGVGRSLFQNSATSGTSTGSASPPVSSPQDTPAATPPSPPETGSKPATTGGSRSLWRDGAAPTASPAPSTTAMAAGTTADESASAEVPAEDEDFAAGDAPATTAAEPAAVVTAEPAPTTSVAPAPETTSETATAAPDMATATIVETLPPPTETDIAALENGGEEVAVDAPTVAPSVATTADARVVIGARADSWLQIQGPGNELVMTRILRAGETYAVPDRPGLVMITGNAGGIEIKVDGQTIAPLGPMGVVKRGIALDPDSLRATFGVASQ